jgi:hypothetical protein
VDDVRKCCSGLEVQGFVLERTDLEEPDTGAYLRPEEIVKPIEVTEGMWYLGERIIKVQKAIHGSGQLYTKELLQTRCVDEDDPIWEFQLLKGGRALLQKSDKARKMTLEEAMQFGKLYGICCACGRTLTNELSIELGIGPYCRSKF